MTALHLLGTVLLVASLPFFLSGTVGLLRLPDVYTRLHALTKADNLGLGLLAAGLACQAPSLRLAVKILLVWLFVLLASSTSCHLIARSAYLRGVTPWHRRP